MSAVTPDKIMHLALGFWGSKTLLSAVELGVFTELAQAPADLPTLHPGDGQCPAVPVLGLIDRGSEERRAAR